MLQEAFQNRYISKDICDPSIIAESVIFDALTLDPTMAIETFHGQVLEKGSKLDKPERDLTSKFILGLPQQLYSLYEQEIPDVSRMLTSRVNSERHTDTARPVLACPFPDLPTRTDQDHSAPRP